MMNEEYSNSLLYKNESQNTLQGDYDLSELLSNENHVILLESLRKKGVYTAKDFLRKFSSESLLRYCNRNDLYTWKDRLLVASEVKSILNKFGNYFELATNIDNNASSGFLEGGMIVDFNKSMDYSFTRPTDVFIEGIEQNVSNWTDFYIALCEFLITKHPLKMNSLLTTPLFTGSTRLDFRAEKVNGLNSKILSNGSWAITNYCSTILIKMAEELCKHCGYPPSNLMIHFERIGEGNKLTRRKYKEKGIKNHQIIRDSPTLFGSINDLIANFLFSRGLSSSTIDEIISGIKPHSVSRQEIIRFVEDNLQVVEITKNRFINKRCIVDLDEAAKTLLELIQIQFTQFDGYSNIRLLFEAARIHLSLFMNDNAFEDEIPIYYLTKHLFSKECYQGYRFLFVSNVHIWEQKPDYPQTVQGLLIHMARINGGKITRFECESFFEKIKVGMDSFTQGKLTTDDPTFYQYNVGEFLLSESLKIDKSWENQVKKALDDVFLSLDLIIPREMSEECFLNFPELPNNIPWTPLLLQEVLSYNQLIGYRTIFASLQQSKNTVAAAIVPVESEYKTFEDVVISMLNSQMELPKRMDAEDLRLLLRKEGMVTGNELIYNMHKALNDFRFAWTDNNQIVYIQKG